MKKKVMQAFLFVSLAGNISIALPCVVGVGPEGNEVHYCIEEDEVALVGEDSTTLYDTDQVDGCSSWGDYGGPFMEGFTESAL